MNLKTLAGEYGESSDEKLETNDMASTGKQFYHWHEASVCDNTSEPVNALLPILRAHSEVTHRFLSQGIRVKLHALL